MDKTAYLNQIDLFRQLSPEELQAVDRLAELQTVSQGTLLLDPTRFRPVLYLLKRGYVRLYRITPEGRQLTVSLLGPGNVFGELEGLSTGTRHSFAEAVTDMLVCTLREADLERLMRTYPEVAVRMVLSGRLRELEDMLERLALSSVWTRVLHLLTKLAESFGVPEGRFVRLEVGLTHQDLADMVGCSRETVTLTLGELARQGVVRTARRRVWVDLPRAQAQLQTG
ncbi:MAG: Crp/Fnr family transcriptional regulator [Armatimonadetes bacterium]|nr:Crp/Fnr family transcriptional regulator [Armatimonadota bacterium]MDW8154552.1 Crp/Fnr family transcriptional regulator [Armatimonadota bacterium]